MRLKNLLILIGLVISTNLTGNAQSVSKIEYGLKVISPGVYCDIHLSEKFYVTSELGFAMFFAYEFSNDIQPGNLYLSPFYIRFEPRYKINDMLFTGLQIKYGFPINNFPGESIDYIEDWISFSGAFGMRKEWNKLFLEIETGLGFIQNGTQPDLAIFVDVGFGVKLNKYKK